MSRVNIASALSEQAARQPEATALILPRRHRRGWTERRYSYGELDKLCDRLAAGLAAADIGPGTRVAFMVPPSLEFFALFFALFRAGCVPVLIDPGIGIRPLKACLGEAKPEVFIGIPRAQVARMLLGWARGSIRRTVTVGPRPFGRGLRYKNLLTSGRQPRPAETGPDDPAAILFTSGSTGIPKGVIYRHRHFAAQVELMRETFGMQPGEVDLPTFPPFALFDPALGMTTVIPPMDFTRPARVDPVMLVDLIERHRVTNLFGSPALMNTLTRHLDAHGIRLPTLKRVLSAGAPVPPAVVDRIHRAIEPEADIHTPYGATEVLPVATISGRELAGGLSEGNRAGQGICVGRPLAANRVRIIAIDDGAIERLEDAAAVTPGAIGEICVAGPTVTDTYWQRDEQTRLAKMTDAEGTLWHRMGDVGRIDDEGRLWYCGRKSERVETGGITLFTECVEGRVNAVDGVYRSALVREGKSQAAIIVEPEPGADRARLETAVRARLDESPETARIGRILFHRSLPVDIRHNAKIRRGELARWAADR